MRVRERGNRKHDMALSHWLKDRMRDRGLNQAKLAKLIGVNQSTISNWLQDLATPSVENVVAIASIFSYDERALLEMVGYVPERSVDEPTGDEQQVVDRLRLLRGEDEYHPTIQTVISVIDLVLATKDSGTAERSG